MFDPTATDRELAAVVVKFTRATSADLRHLSNIAAIAAEMRHDQEAKGSICEHRWEFHSRDGDFHNVEKCTRCPATRSTTL